MCEQPTAGQAPTRWTIPTLDPSERAVVMALRGWKSCGRTGGLAMARLAVAEAGLPGELVLPLAATLGILAAFGAGNRPDARCLKCSKLALDEAILLDTIASLQVGADREAARLIQPWVGSPIARGMVLASLQDLADSLIEAGCRLPGIHTMSLEAESLLMAAE
jgi:hypothetical protein